jgi:hypothetical protein
MTATEPLAVAPSRHLLVVAGAVIGLVVVTVGAVLLAGGSGGDDLEPGSPQAVVRDYLAALEDGDLEAAHALFSDRIRERWDLDAFEREVEMMAPYGPMDGGGPSRRVLFDRVETNGDRSVVHLTVEEFWRDGLSGSSYTYGREIRMVREAGGWRIDQRLVWLDPVLAPVP